MANRSFCNQNRLRMLLDDGLSNEQEAEVVGHLDDCAACQKKLETLAAEEVWWEHLRHLPTDDKKNTAPHLKRAAQQASTAMPNRAGDGGDDNIWLDFLDPASTAAHLGRLDHFEITELLGRGGMGIVLKASDPALNRPVAIKVLAPHFASSGAARKRFAREAQAAAAVVHDHVVAIHSVGAWKGLPYLVMSYVPGRSLQEVLDAEGPLSIKEITRIGMQAALGLAAAHAQGLVHRDVKPANILLENGIQRVRLTDFGLARAIDDASLTQSGVVTGTPQYMSPEQTRSEAVDHRTDLFSLGSTLYAMCTGHAPFRADTAMAVLLRVGEEQPRAVRQLNPDVPVWLAAIVEKLHAKAPAQRFQSAAEVADLLGRCLAHLQEPTINPLPPLAGWARAHRQSGRRWQLAVGTLLFMSVIAMAGWELLGGRRSDQGRDKQSGQPQQQAPGRAWAPTTPCSLTWTMSADRRLGSKPSCIKSLRHSKAMTSRPIRCAMFASVSIVLSGN